MRTSMMLIVMVVAVGIGLSVTACPARPSGNSGDASLDGGAVDSRINPVPCRPELCPGCCGADGRCHPGDADRACGLGVECADCAALGGRCEERECTGQAPCSPELCPGCCDASGRCLQGTTNSACGTADATCMDCGDEVCEGGTCVPGCHDEDGDGYGPGCPLGDDCDDRTPGIVGPCDSNGCPQGWAFVPAGPFIMGCEPGEDPGCTRNSPYNYVRQLVTLEGFCIQRTEVSVADPSISRLSLHPRAAAIGDHNANGARQD